MGIVKEASNASLCCVLRPIEVFDIWMNLKCELIHDWCIGCCWCCIIMSIIELNKCDTIVSQCCTFYFESMILETVKFFNIQLFMSVIGF